MAVLSHMTLLVILAQQQPNPVLSEVSPIRITVQNPVRIVFLYAEPQTVAVNDERDHGEKPGRVVVLLKSRRHTVTVYTGQRFGIASNDGKVLAGNIGVKEFQKRFPGVYQYYRWSYAEAWAGMDFGRTEVRTGNTSSTSLISR
jgi:hypothetical protein